MYERIVVATGTTRPATAVTVASALGAEVGALELVTVTSPGTPLGVDRAALERLALQHGWLPASCAVLPGRDVATTVVHHVARRRDALLVIGAHGHHPLAPPDGTLTDQVLAATGSGPSMTTRRLPWRAWKRLSTLGPTTRTGPVVAART
jgi:nucleotide-binding universal stress UspA family protein